MLYFLTQFYVADYMKVSVPLHITQTRVSLNTEHKLIKNYFERAL
jgi:hypothetical protein